MEKLLILMLFVGRAEDLSACPSVCLLADATKHRSHGSLCLSLPLCQQSPLPCSEAALLPPLISFPRSLCPCSAPPLVEHACSVRSPTEPSRARRPPQHLPCRWSCCSRQITSTKQRTSWVRSDPEARTGRGFYSKPPLFKSNRFVMTFAPLPGVSAVERVSPQAPVPGQFGLGAGAPQRLLQSVGQKTLRRRRGNGDQENRSLSATETPQISILEADIHSAASSSSFLFSIMHFVTTEMI